MIKKIVAAFVLSIALLVWIAQEDLWFKQHITERICTLMSDAGQCSMSGDPAFFNFFFPCVQFDNVEIVPVINTTWRCSARHVRITFSWWRLLWRRVAGIHISVYGAKVESECSGGSIHIFDHVMHILTQQLEPLPVELVSCVFADSEVTIADSGSNTTVSWCWSSESKMVDEVFKSHLYFKSGYVNQLGRTYIDDCSGVLRCDASMSDAGMKLVGSVDGSLLSPVVTGKNDRIGLSGLWSGRSGYFTMHNLEKTFFARISNVHQQKRGLAAALDLVVPVAQCTRTFFPGSAVTGDATVHADLLYGSSGIERAVGTCTVNNLYTGATQVCDVVHMDINKRRNLWSAALHAYRNDLRIASGAVRWDSDTGALTGSCENSAAIVLSEYSSCMRNWTVAPGSLYCTFLADNQNELSAIMSVDAHDPIYDQDSMLSAVLDWGASGIGVHGHCNDYVFTVSIDRDRSHSVRVSCMSDESHDCISFVQSECNRQVYTGIVDLDVARCCLSALYDYDIQAQGVVKVHMMLGNPIVTRIAGDDIIIRVPGMYNFIDGIRMRLSYEPATKKSTIMDAVCSLYRGSIRCKRASLFFDESYCLRYIHVPFFVDDLLLHYKKDIFVTLGANAVYTYGYNLGPLLRASVLLNHVQVHDVGWVARLQQEKEGFGLQSPFAFDYDCLFETCQPIAFKTDLLDAQTEFSMRVTGSSGTAPSCSGALTCKSGTVFFPYKPLYITSGVVRFEPDASADPFIEIIASNTIKRYNVGLHITGSLHNHHVMLESSPSLSQEQLLSLLFAGSIERSLNSVMPALLMNNITQYVFGYHKEDDTQSPYVKALLKPFKYIHVVPSFTDQSGRGGLRAAIEIDIADRWRALLQKNFSLSEDTRFELEYALSNEVSVRGVRDERRDIGGEVEMRWKF